MTNTVDDETQLMRARLRGENIPHRLIFSDENKQGRFELYELHSGWWYFIRGADNEVFSRITTKRGEVLKFLTAILGSKEKAARTFEFGGREPS